MENSRRKKLEEQGWKIGNTAEFLALTPEEEAYIELKLMLSKHVQIIRQKKKLTQGQLAKLLKSSQSRVAKMEAGDPTVSVDLLIRSLFALGTTRKSIARVLGS